MFCEKCGAQMPDGAKFCPACGAQSGAPVGPEQTVYQAPTQHVYQAPAQQDTGRVPWHSRGKLSPLYARHKRVSILFATALTVLQAVLFLIFAAIGEDAEADMLTAQLVGFVPTAVLIIYLFCLDTIEKEPPLLLGKLFLVEGVLTMLVVAYVELALMAVLGLFLEEDTVAYRILENLLCVALVEEGFKYAVLRKFTWKHPAFNYRFDGIIYAAVTALGFAAFENFSYISSYGFGVALTRMVSAVPGHCVDGILMGIFYGKAKQFDAQGNRALAARNCRLAILAPIAEHGFYDFFANTGESALSMILFYAYVFILNAVVFVLVWRLAQKDEAICRPQYAAWQ